MRPKPALRTELLFYLSFLAAAALLVGVATTVVATSVVPTQEFWMVMVLVALEVGIFLVFGRHLVTRLVLRPLERLMSAADAVADGDLNARAPDAETRDFATLAERVNRMTDHLLDAQSQLVRSEKLASVGRLAAGIAHEVGNPLGAVGTYVEVLRRRGAEPQVISGLTRELDRIDHIVRSLLAYARPQEEAYDPGRAAPRRASDPGLASFGRRPARRPARVEFSAGAPGALVFVADGGPGVPPQDREKIFEPFFTTKDPGRGTGLGLAIVARAVHDMGGVVWVDTAREGGAAFKMFFPEAVNPQSAIRNPQ